VDTADDNTVILYEDEAIITLMNRPPQANGLLREATVVRDLLNHLLFNV